MMCGVDAIEVSTTLDADLRRAAGYRAGRPLTDDEVVRAIEDDLRRVLEDYRRLGRWIADLDLRDRAAPPMPATRPRPVPLPPPAPPAPLVFTPRPQHRLASDETKARMSAGLRNRWAHATAADRARCRRKPIRKEA